MILKLIVIIMNNSTIAKIFIHFLDPIFFCPNAVILETKKICFGAQNFLIWWPKLAYFRAQLIHFRAQIICLGARLIRTQRKPKLRRIDYSQGRSKPET